MLQIGALSMPFSPDLKALHILRQNVRTILERRKESEALLAHYLGFKHRSSINKFLNNDRAGFQMWRLDRLAAFLGIPVYQLFQPGVSALAERRKGGDRRSGRERRIGHQNRLISHLRMELNKVPRLTSAAAANPGETPYEPRSVSSVPAPVQAILNRADQDIAAYYATHPEELGQQAPSARRKIAGAPSDRGGVRRSDAKTSK